MELESLYGDYTMDEEQDFYASSPLKSSGSKMVSLILKNLEPVRLTLGYYTKVNFESRMDSFQAPSDRTSVLNGLSINRYFLESFPRAQTALYALLQNYWAEDINTIEQKSVNKFNIT